MTDLTSTEPSDTSTEEEKYDSPDNSVWVLAVAEDGSTSVMKRPNIDPNFFDEGNDCESIGLPTFLNLPAGTYKVNCSFSSTLIPCHGYVEEHSFTPMHIDPLWVL
jgi:hypothetical protein